MQRNGIKGKGKGNVIFEAMIINKKTVAKVREYQLIMDADSNSQEDYREGFMSKIV